MRSLICLPKSVWPFWRGSADPRPRCQRARSRSQRSPRPLPEWQSGRVQVFGPVLYSHLLKLASEKTSDRAADLWVPDLNLPLADMLPTNYVQSEAVRLEIYGRAARCWSEDDLEDLEEEAARRLGKLPPAACDFFGAARLRIECRRRGIVRLDVSSVKNADRAGE